MVLRRILRPVFFMDNFTPDLFGKITAASWASKLGFDKSIQMVAVKVSCCVLPHSPRFCCSAADSVSTRHAAGHRGSRRARPPLA